MKCSNPGCNRDIGLVTFRHAWLSKRRYCSQHCLNGLVRDARQKRRRFELKRLVVRLIVPAVFTMAILASPAAHPEAPQLPSCDHKLANASANVAAMQARIKSSNGVDRSEICTATQLYFFEVVKARALIALCESGPERERDLDRLDADVAHTNEAIAARCL